MFTNFLYCKFVFIEHSFQRSDIGYPNKQCVFCGALHWAAECISDSANHGKKIYSLCCKKGKIKLPMLKQTPLFLDTLLTPNGNPFSLKFKENIRLYNFMFAFTSTGGKIDYEINKKPGPYVFGICGQNHHVIGSLLPDDGEKPKFAQLYIYDTQNETNNRISSFLHNDSGKNINSFIVEGLIKMFDQINVLAKSFRMARDRFVEDDMLPVKLKLLGRRHNDSSQYSVPSSSEIAGLIVGDYGLYDKK